jgi:hypothetical protein
MSIIPSILLGLPPIGGEQFRQLLILKNEHKIKNF